MLKKEDFGVGMKVRCYNKTVAPTSWSRIQQIYGKNPIGITTSYNNLNNNEVEIEFFDGKKYLFDLSDIGLTIQDEPIKKYVVTDHLTLANFIQKNPCQNELLKLIEQFPMQTKYTLEQVTSHQIWTDWLIQNGFIQEIKPEKFYHLGQKFTFLNENYILAQVDNSKMCLINLNNGNRQENPVSVNCVSKISQEEFNKIAGNDSYLLVEKE